MQETAQIDSPQSLGKYFLPYQVAAILDEHRLLAWEKSIRIGATYAMGFRAVRDRLLKKGDYLISSVSLPAALEFVEQCRKWHDVFGIAALSMGEIDWEDSIEGKAYQIAYDKANRIIAFSSNPKAIRSFGGAVGIDELAFHKDPPAMRKAAGGRAMWGYPVAMWSSHNGADSEWNKFLTEERARGGARRWHIMRTTLPEAIEQGLVEKINATRGTAFTREEFVDETKAMVGGEEAYREECLCEPCREGGAAVKWNLIEAAKQDYEIMRINMTEAGNSVSTTLIECGIGPQQRSALGYDVARTGDLAAVWINSQEPDQRWKLRALVTMRGMKFGTQRELVATVLRMFPAMVAAGDATGLGMQVCEELADEFGEARFAKVNFSAMKPELGTKLVRIYEDGRQILPNGSRYDEIFQDIAGIRSQPTPSGRIQFYETPNPVNKHSHCDMAWSNALALLAGEENVGNVGICVR